MLKLKFGRLYGLEFGEAQGEVGMQKTYCLFEIF